MESDGRIMGCVAIVKFSREEAQLRWLLLHPDLRGRGLGRRLVEEAASFCRDGGLFFLWTVSTPALAAAARLYRSICFHRFFVIKTNLAGACLVHRILGILFKACGKALRSFFWASQGSIYAILPIARDYNLYKKQ